MTPIVKHYHDTHCKIPHILQNELISLGVLFIMVFALCLNLEKTKSA